MIESFKKNPKKLFAAVALVFFALAIVLMVLPGFYLSGEFDLNASDGGFAYVSLFALAFGGKLFSGTNGEPELLAIKGASNPMILASFILLILAVICLVIILYAIVYNKLTKKSLIIITAIAIILTIVSSILIFVSKDSSLRVFLESLFRTFSEEEPTKEIIDEAVKYFKEVERQGLGKITIGSGGIVTPIMALLGACSLTGVICLSAKEAK